jgi:broad specificity phosphatase PhoE
MRTKPPSGTTYLYLIRHGATAANEKRPYILQGDGIDLGLSSSGQRQASEVGDFLSTFHLDHVYCSPMIRARETAQAIATPHGKEIEPVDDLVECCVGMWEGLDWETIQQRNPEEARLFLENPADNPYFGGVSYGVTLQRVRPVFEELLQKHRGESIAIVAHNVVNRVYLASLLGLETRRAKDLKQQNACVNLISSDEKATQLVTMNSVFHLSEPPL